MNTNPFLSKKVNPKRIWKGIGIVLPLTIILFIVGNYTINLIDNTLRNHYIGEKQEKVLGDEDKKSLQEFSLPPNSPFYADEYVDTHIDEREGYSKLTRFIDSPTYYFKDGDVVTLKDSWLLKNGYELNLVCEEVDLEKKLDPAEYLKCKIYYNGNLVADNIHYEAGCYDLENFKDCSGTVSFAVFSSTYPEGSPELLATSYMPSGFDSSVSIFNLENGEAKRLSFESKEGEIYEDIGARVFMFELYGKEDEERRLQPDINTIEFVNYQWNPGYWGEGIRGLYHIWKIEGDRFIENKSITIIETEE